MFSNKLEIEDKGEEDVMQVCIAEEVGDHGYQNREHWMRMQFEVKITSLSSESLNLRHGDISRVEMFNIRKS